MENQKKLVYVADSSDSIRDLVVIALGDYAAKGYEIEKMGDGSELKVWYDRKKPDLVILGNDLPGITGIGFIGYVRDDLDDDVPIIMASRRSGLGILAQEYDFVFVEKDAHFLDNIRKKVEDFLGESDQPS